MLVARRGPATASAYLAGPTALFARLQRGSLIGWTVALFLLGATFGSLTDSVISMVKQNALLARVFAISGTNVADSFTAGTSVEFGLGAAAFAVASVLRLRAEESAGRMELLLATPMDRRRLLGCGGDRVGGRGRRPPAGRGRRGRAGRGRCQRGPGRDRP